MLRVDSIRIIIISVFVLHMHNAYVCPCMLVLVLMGNEKQFSSLLRILMLMLVIVRIVLVFVLHPALLSMHAAHGIPAFTEYYRWETLCMRILILFLSKKTNEHTKHKYVSSWRAYAYTCACVYDQWKTVFTTISYGRLKMFVKTAQFANLIGLNRRCWTPPTFLHLDQSSC